MKRSRLKNKANKSCKKEDKRLFLHLIKKVSKLNSELKKIYFNPNLSGLFMGSFCGVGCKNTRCLKLVKIMLETCNLVCYYTHICIFRKYTF